MPDWLSEHPELVEWAVLASLLTFVGSLLALPLFVAALPPDYFARPEAPPSAWKDEHPVLRAVVFLVKNGLGALLLAAGLMMLLLPGQGILTILAGLTLLSFPRKRELELWFVRRPRVIRALNWLRRKVGKIPFVVWPGRGAEEEGEA